MDRKQIYQKIKTLNLGATVVKQFGGRNCTQVSTAELIKFLEKYTGKAVATKKCEKPCCKKKVEKKSCKKEVKPVTHPVKDTCIIKGKKDAGVKGTPFEKLCLNLRKKHIITNDEFSAICSC